MLALGLGWFALDIWLHTRSRVLDAKGEQLGRDFVNFWAGGRLAARGQAAQAYDVQSFLAFERSQTGPGAEFKIYSYPPVATLLSLPLGGLPYGAAFAAWTLSGVAAASALLSRMLGWRWALIATCATPAFILNVIAGQNGAFSAGLLGGGLLLLERRPALAGVLFGLLCYKPQLGVLLPVALVASGSWRAVAAAAATAAVTVGASVAMLGPAAWLGFLHALPLHRLLLEQDPQIWRRIPTVFVGLRAAGVSPSLATSYRAPPRWPRRRRCSSYGEVQRPRTSSALYSSSPSFSRRPTPGITTW